MQIQYIPENFVLIYQNSHYTSSIYNFIRVIPTKMIMPRPPIKGVNTIIMREYDLINPSGTTVKGYDGITYMFETGSSADKQMFGNKTKWVQLAIDSRLFNNAIPYLYIHDGIYGFYNFLTKTFHQFDNNVDAKNAVCEFFYVMMSLRDKTLNYQSCEVNKVQFEVSPEDELDLSSDSDDDINNDDSDSECEDDVKVPIKKPLVQQTLQIPSVPKVYKNPWINDQNA